LFEEAGGYGGAMGFVTTIALVSAFGLLALRPPMPRHSSRGNVQFGLGVLINEPPILGLYWLAAGTVPTLPRFNRDLPTAAHRPRCPVAPGSRCFAYYCSR